MFWKKADSKNKRPWVRKRVWVPITIVIAVGALFCTPLPKVDYPPEKITQGEYMDKFLQDNGNGFHDLMYAVRIQKDFNFSTNNQGDKTELYNQFSNLCDLDVSKGKIDPKIVERVIDNQKTIDAIREGISKTCTVPEVTTKTTLLPYLAGFRELARLKIADAKVKESQRDINGAYQDYYDTFKIGRAASNGGVLIHGLVGIAIDSMAVQAMWPTIKTLDDQQLRELIQELESAENNATTFIEVLKPEHKMIKEIMELSSKRWVAADITTGYLDNKEMQFVGIPKTVTGNSFWLYFLVNKGNLERTTQEYIRESERFAEMPHGSPEEKEIQAYLESKDGPIENNLVLQVLAPALVRAKAAFKRMDTYFRGTRLSAARALYQKKNRELTSLDQLITSGILKELPIDPFSGQPFKYADAKIYSFGHDQDDDQAIKNVFEKDEKGRMNLMGDGDMVF